MSAHQAEYRVTMMARLLGISTSGFYAWKDREPSARAIENERLLERIRTLHLESDGNYGRLRIWKDLLEDEDTMRHHVGHNRVGRLMRKAGLVGVTRRRECWTTVRDRGVQPAPELVRRDFVADAPSSGSPTSPTSRRGRGSCTWRSCSTCSVDASSAGRWRTTSGRS